MPRLGVKASLSILGITLFCAASVVHALDDSTSESDNGSNKSQQIDKNAIRKCVQERRIDPNPTH